jgi:glycosyltransferase involved in cell wall biosynthesis
MSSPTCRPEHPCCHPERSEGSAGDELQIPRFARDDDTARDDNAVPKVSIILPTYNRLEYLRETVASVRAQTLTDWELIVVDDESTDGSIAWLESLNEPRLTVVPCRHSGNPARVRNAGVARARGPWVAFLDSDDAWLPDKLATQLAELTGHPSCRWSCTGVSFIDGVGTPIAQQGGLPYRAQSGWIVEELLTFTAAATISTLIVDRTLLSEVGGFDEAVFLREDYDLALRLATRSEIHALSDALTLIRHHPGRSTSQERIADLHRTNDMVFRKFARATDNPRHRAICRRQSATQLISRARALSFGGEHRAALTSSMHAILAVPLMREAWRSAAASALRSVGWKRAHRS